MQCEQYNLIIYTKEKCHLILKISNIMKIKLTILFSIMVMMLFGQTAKFKWSDLTCEHESKYKTNLYTETQINNCYLLTQDDVFRIANTPSVFNPEDIKSLNLDTLDQEFKTKSLRLKTLDIPKTKEWENIRNKILIELDQLYTLSRIVYVAYLSDDYNALSKYNSSDTCLQKHSSALIAGGDSLLNNWYDITTELAQNNGSPENIWKKYYQNLSSENKFLFAKVDVTTFGWWNCAVIYVEFFDRNLVLKEFKKLFINTKQIDCNEP